MKQETLNADIKKYTDLLQKVVVGYKLTEDEQVDLLVEELAWSSVVIVEEAQDRSALGVKSLLEVMHTIKHIHDNYDAEAWNIAYDDVIAEAIGFTEE